MSEMRTVTLIGGPLDGLKHKLRHPFPDDFPLDQSALEPAALAIPTDPVLDYPKAWYLKDDDGEFRFWNMQDSAPGAA